MSFTIQGNVIIHRRVYKDLYNRGNLNDDIPNLNQQATRVEEWAIYRV